MHQSSIHKPSHGHGGKALTKDLIFTKTRNDNLFGIKNLNLWGNDLQDLSLLNQMPNLEVISLSVNNIKTLKFFQNCFKLQELYLRKNDIKVLNQIQYLMNLPELKVLWLCDNPCANTKNYRQIVLQNLPNLIKLDNDVITEKQRQNNQNFQNNQSLNYNRSSHIQDQGQSQRRQSQRLNPTNKSNYQSIKSKANNYVLNLQENQSQITTPSDSKIKNASDRRIQQNYNNLIKNSDSPLKVLNTNKRMTANQYQMQEIIAKRGIHQSGGKITVQDRLLQHEAYSSQDNQSDSIRKQNVRGSMVNEPSRTQNRVSTNSSQVMKQKRQQVLQNSNNRNSASTPTSKGQINSNNYLIQKQQTISRREQQNERLINASNNRKGQQYRNQYQSQKFQKMGANHIQTQQFQHQERQRQRQQALYCSSKSYKKSSPNIIMAIMSLLDDLDEDGLEIIKRQSQRKLIQKKFNEQQYHHKHKQIKQQKDQDNKLMMIKQHGNNRK